MKSINLWISLILASVVIFTSCRPGLKTDQPLAINSGNLSNYWEQYSADLVGDTIVLGKKNATLLSDFTLKNFTLSADIYTTEGAEGSLGFHTGSAGDTLVKGYSVLINNSDYRSGSPQKTGSLSRIRNNFVRTAIDYKWFPVTVEVKANNIKVTVNNKIVSEYSEPENPLRIEGLTNMRLSEGNLLIIKTSDNGTIKIANLSITKHSDDIPRIDDRFTYDSTGEMLSLLNQQGFPVIDFHGHLKGGLTVDQVCAHGRLNGYNYGLAPNCGLNFPVTNDSSLIAYYNEMAPEPVFKAMQCEGREWITLFSPDAISLYDYIFTDAMTWTDHKGRRMRLWIPEETFVENEQRFMDMLVGKIESVLSQEPVDIHVNPTFLPPAIADKYDELWTEERMDRVIKVLVDNDVALEINSRYKIPSLAFIKRAKAAGVKFTFGTNNGGSDDLGRLEYSLKIVKEAGITPDDMFLPRPAGDKKVLKKGLPAKITG
ncbi:MAG TPA: family 16 glycoside hydrolase [Bacteroidales bacterium]|nr:family 16 glycoside hydrolase [Bacteroidales bacterium]